MTSSCPADVLGWIAWYVDGDLSDAQRGAVEAHAAGCAACREEIAMLEGAAAPAEGAPDPERLLARIWQRVDAVEEPAAAGADEEGDVAAPTPLRPRTQSSAPAREAGWGRSPLAAAAALLIAALGGWLLASLTADPVYTTATAPGVEAPAAPALDVVFEDGATAADTRALLRSVDAEIVSGPSAVGRYRLRIPAGADPARLAERLRSEGAGVVLLAEPALP